MSERILKALMQLFSIVADAEDINGNSRKIVASFLKQQLSLDLVEEYLGLFDKFLDEKKKKADGKKRKKRTSVNSVKVLLICTQINEELEQKQKTIVLIRLLEFIYSGESTTDQELEFVSTVAETFNIPVDEFELCKLFVESKSANEIDNTNALIINNEKQNTQKESKHIYSEGVTDEICIIRIQSVNMFFVKYYGSNELYLNGLLIDKTRSHVLTQGSSIRSSKVQPIYYSDIIGTYMSDSSSEKIIFNVDNITYRFKGGNMGMNELSFTEESGRMVGIMGASGAGKSTMLNLLNGMYTPTTGTVTINGIDIHNEVDEIEGVIGFVSQDDLLIEELTVFQNLFYNAKLCFSQLKDKEIAEKVNQVLQSIGLFEAKDLKVGSPLDKTISGGQRKRLNIALELIREPSVLFVDEPTSGLSSRDSENIMDLLKELSLKGKLVFVVIHQPSSDIFKMFDSLLILDTGGYPIYLGNPVDAVVYFKTIVNHVNSNESECPSCGNVNPEQIFNIIESKVVDEYGNATGNRKILPKQWYKYYLEKIHTSISNFEGKSKPPSSFNIPNKLKQFKVFITRDVLSKLTNKQYLFINLLEAPVLAFILAFLVKFFNNDANNELGYIFRENENVPAYIFMAVIVALFIGLTVSAEEIIRDQRILKREKFLNLSRGSYLFSKISIMFVLSAIQTISFVLVGNLVLDIKGMYISYWFVLFSTACFANLLGLNISASFNSAVTIYILIPFLIIPQLILSGVIVKFDKLNPVITVQNSVPFAGDLMTSRWAFEAIAVHQFKDNEFEKNFYKYDRAFKEVEFKKNFWLAELREKLSSSQNNFNNPEKKGDIENNLTLLRNEIGIELQRNKNVKFNFIDDLYYDKLTPEVFSSTKRYLNDLNAYYLKRYKETNSARDKVASEMNKDKTAKEEFIKLKDNYTNDALSDLIKDKSEFNKIIELDNRLYQNADPIYLIPDGFRAQFFAPKKKLFGKYIDTYWANLIVIWSMTLLLIITLYFNVLRWIITSLEKLAGGGFKG